MYVSICLNFHILNILTINLIIQEENAHLLIHNFIIFYRFKMFIKIGVRLCVYFVCVS